ncbi:hypothetical protein SLA_6070 [Streptomyces laurentii]|uniref:Uncharacterized protein n=1 Tax=Streptomyces laurentii TaxID=39478 RepID=A0A160P5B6_STRLU|nr:hypothetical protein SLA_6070 [Streptomyces laurentii]
MIADRTPPYLPAPSTRSALMGVDERWSAVRVLSHWSHLVLGALGALGAQGGPAFEDLGLCHIVWPLPPGGADDWPDATAAGVLPTEPGERLLVPGLKGMPGMPWLHPPAAERPFTDPGVLRRAVETVIGSLEDAGALGPVAVCHECGAATRDAELVAFTPQMCGPGWSTYECRSCYDGRGRRRTPEVPR